jgi:hypothetical protein
MGAVGFALTLRGDRGALLVGSVESTTFGRWALSPRPGSRLADLRVTNEKDHPYYARKAPTGIRIHFSGATGNTAIGTVYARRDRPNPASAASDEQTWWTWRAVVRVGPGHYTVEGLPEVS